MIRLRSAWFPAVVLLVTVAELAAAAWVPGVDQLEGKGWPLRLLLYPTLMLAAPAVWWLTIGRRQPDVPTPYAAFVLMMLPFWSDTTANWLDLFRSVAWWDDLSHFGHWLLLCSGLGLLLDPYVRPRWVVVPLVAGIGALLALGWELGEWWTFIRHGREADGAYQDTLGDLTLGSLGALLAALLVAALRTRSTRHRPG